ncbi:thyroid adenoma-associated protein homolog [Nomia melanderi]|uniref:thyroid adenoma-associated protein homolog n=1 Tax=Nomia melanderi TaxID=2448451 RepID=UPI0013046CF5|nr:thyroid adenoma-associated protein homolog [Nomia melanderi]XP_031835839.1 thyroid adenoma-associated protein homolog [Nomia melanderi]XP_031835840.1 thyroid adenoma-associated protein homolog [Nomia melanderi]XP_031835841.1 thyroid adenoma-associated protein homolog [Nomia melanderi]XP_031835843.1 thyroid adenoma-associated protein homolog [Nomia melanderi]XP_031835844.1 thyroid adenoma-associated protein homolog [Nomia melanderi]XP_031835845.1 thyroid adenoma-associated protein homolog [
MTEQEEIKKKLKELLALKRSGELDTNERLFNPKDESLWRDSIAYDTLQYCVQHHDDEIKLNALALIIESKKSTLKFFSKELGIVILFLRINFKEKIEYVPLIKKALKRMKDSLAVMRRQCSHEEKMRSHYEKNCDLSEMKQQVLDTSNAISAKLKEDIAMYCSAFKSLRETCICGPDATYCRRRSSLQILLLMRDLLDNEFQHISWTAEQTKALFDLMILDTYEVNKEMAFNLIKSVDPILLQLDNESNVLDLVTVAIELGNSIRPIDSITSAYMLKVCMLSPVIQKVLNTLFGIRKWSENVEEAIALQLILILLKRLKESLILARENIVMTVTKHSLYGYLFCIRSLLQECNLSKAGKELLWEDTVGELIAVCFEYSDAVSVIVNNSSPEGHLPMDLNLQTIQEICGSSPEKEIVTPQMVLLCSWRTVKEVSLLFGYLATNAPICENDLSVGLLNEEQIIRIGEHLVTLLTETKHRGAFEQAHVGFSQLCKRLWRLNKGNLNELPRIWLHQILIAITGIKQENPKLCATRRSAGVPFMIQALLSTELRQHKDTKTTTFDSVMKILLGFTQLEGGDLWKTIKTLLYTDTVFSEYEDTFESLTTDDDGHHAEGSSTKVTEIKTHALNILRAIFRHSGLAEVVNNYVADGLIAAFKSYDALTWAERNAATLLFSALIIRIFGVQRTKDHINLTTDNKMNYRVFFEKYPYLLPFILDELQSFVVMNETIIKTNVQSILLLLSRLYFSHSCEASDIQCKITNLIGLVMQCAKSEVYETRKLAARALVALLTDQSVGNILKEIMEYVISAEKGPPSLNLIHGYMLQIFEILKHFSHEQLQPFSIDWNRFLTSTGWILKNLERENQNPPCFLLATVYINVFNKIYEADKVHLAEEVPMLHTLLSHLIKYKKLKQGPARGDYKISLIRSIRTVFRERQLIQENIAIRIYFHCLITPETQIVAWSTVVNVINEITHDDASVLLINYGTEIICNSVHDLNRYSPELQDAMFNFLYNSLMHPDRFGSSSCCKVTDICKFVLNELRLNDNKCSYHERDSYLRLLGKSYVTLASFNEAQEIDLECTEEVYNNFCDNFWVASLDADFKRSVMQIMQDLFLPSCKRDEYRFAQVQWWTTVLQLLLDNNSEVRRQAFELVKSIQVNCSLPSESGVDLFLIKFYEYMHRKNPELLCAVLFYWSTSLLDDVEYEMDDTDVFNKCTNYDFFEPVELSKACAKLFSEHLKSFADNALPEDILIWISSRVNIDMPESSSFKILLENYGNHMSPLENGLYDILDPTYKNKLLQILMYKEYKDMLP